MYKIVGIGACVVDTLISAPFYPNEDTKLRAEEVRIAGGGPVATGLVAANKLGIDTAYIGKLSDDTGGKFLISDFEKYGVCTDFIEIARGYRSFASYICLSAESTSRTCIFDKGNVPPLKLSDEQIEAIKSAEILMVDGNELSATISAAKIAKQSGTKVLYDCGGLYEGIEPLLELTDIMIPSEEFALKITGCNSAKEAAKVLYNKYSPEIVVITRGKNGGLLYNGERIIDYPIYPADVVDSNGSGDVFHGAFAAALIYGFDYEKCCHFASAVSAIKCMGIGARESVPDYDTVMKYLKENGYEL